MWHPKTSDGIAFVDYVLDQPRLMFLWRPVRTTAKWKVWLLLQKTKPPPPRPLLKPQPWQQLPVVKGTSSFDGHFYLCLVPHFEWYNCLHFSRVVPFKTCIKKPFVINCLNGDCKCHQFWQSFLLQRTFAVQNDLRDFLMSFLVAD